jgi:hypothetical protein
MAEVFGRRSGGDGVLHTYIRELNMLPIIDPTKLTSTQADDLLELFDTIRKRPALSITDELKQPDRQAFDFWAMKYLFGHDDATEAAVVVGRAIRQLADERTARQQSGKEQVKRAAKRVSFDPGTYATRALLDLGHAPSGAKALEEDETLGTFVVEIPPHGVSGELRLGMSLFDADDVHLGDENTISTPTPAHARLVLALLRRHRDTVGPVILPADESAAEARANALELEWAAWREKTLEMIDQMLPGRSRETQRQAVRQQIEQIQGLWTGALAA